MIRAKNTNKTATTISIPPCQLLPNCYAPRRANIPGPYVPEKLIRIRPARQESVAGLRIRAI
jgi:hypothetical protein